MAQVPLSAVNVVCLHTHLVVQVNTETLQWMMLVVGCLASTCRCVARIRWGQFSSTQVNTIHFWPSILFTTLGPGCWNPPPPDHSWVILLIHGRNAIVGALWNLRQASSSICLSVHRLSHNPLVFVPVIVCGTAGSLEVATV